MGNTQSRDMNIFFISVIGLVAGQTRSWLIGGPLYGSWENWGSCSLSCVEGEAGSQVRIRKCTYGCNSSDAILYEERNVAPSRHVQQLQSQLQSMLQHQQAAQLQAMFKLRSPLKPKH